MKKEDVCGAYVLLFSCVAGGEGRETLSRALRCVVSRRIRDASLGFSSFWGYGGQNFGSCLADTFRKDDRPPTHFFVNKKFSSACVV